MKELIFEHLFIVLAASLLSIIFGLFLGILSYQFPKISRLIAGITDVFQTIPALALLGILMVFFGAGKTTVIVGITLYSLLPIVRNCLLGLQGIDPGIREAAEGMGMGRVYQLFRIELPLAFPTIFTGIRIAVVNAIGTAVFAAFVGGGGLGSMINRGIRIQDMSLILKGTGALMVIAAALDLLMGQIEKNARNYHKSPLKKFAPALALLLILVLLIPYGLKKTGSRELRMYEGDYSETQLLVHMARFLIEDQTGLTVSIQDQMSQVNNFRALTRDEPSCDLMISYDGTILTTFMHQDPSDIPPGTSLYDYVADKSMTDYQLILSNKLGFDNTYAIAARQEIADQYHLETISDLIPAADQLIFGAEHEFFTLEGSMKYEPFTQFYGLHFKDYTSVDISLKYAAAEKGNFDVTEVYSTDGLNRKAGLKVLVDDRHFFPEYNGIYVIRADVADRFPQESDAILKALNTLSGMISTEEMSDLTYQVDVEKQTVDETARQFLTDKGLLR